MAFAFKVPQHDPEPPHRPNKMQELGILKTAFPALFKKTSSLRAGVTRERNKTCKVFYKDIF